MEGEIQYICSDWQEYGELDTYSNSEKMIWQTIMHLVYLQCDCVVHVCTTYSYTNFCQ